MKDQREVASFKIWVVGPVPGTGGSQRETPPSLERPGTFGTEGGGDDEVTWWARRERRQRAVRPWRALNVKTRSLYQTWKWNGS